MVNITEDPQSTGPVLVGERAVFTCRARSIPPPTITWFWFQNGMEVGLVDNGDDITITSQSQLEDNFVTRSVLSVRVTGDEDFTEYFCVGDSGFDSSTSDTATLVQAGISSVSCSVSVDNVSSHYTLPSFPTHTHPHQCTPSSLRGSQLSRIVHEAHTFHIELTRIVPFFSHISVQEEQCTVAYVVHAWQLQGSLGKINSLVPMTSQFRTTKRRTL